MAEILPNQPVIFNEVLDCHLEDSNILMLAQWGDITQFQMGLDVCLSDGNIITNGNFKAGVGWTTYGLGWTFGSSSACHSGTAALLFQTLAVADGTLLRLRFTVDITQGSVVIYIGVSFTEEFTTSGTYERWFLSDQVLPTSTTITIEATAGSIFCISDLTLMTVNNNFEVYVIDSTGATVATIQKGDGYFNFLDGFFTASIDWETLVIPEGCYTLGVFDPCECGQGGIIPLDFITGLSAWTVGGDWTIGGGTASYSGTTPSQSFIEQVLCTAVEYTVKYTISNLTGNATFRVRLGVGLGTLRTANGTYTENITSSGSGTGFYMLGDSTGGAASFDITDASIVITTKTATYTSNVIAVNDADFACGTHSIAMCSDHNGSGFAFVGTGFFPNFRAECSLARGGKTGERQAYEYSNGVKKTTYARSRMLKELGMDLPEHLVFFMYLAPDVDHFYIDGVEYFVEDDEFPTVSWDEWAHQGGFTVDVSIKKQLLENRRLTSNSIGCTDEFLEDGFSKPITTENGDAIITGRD